MSHSYSSFVLNSVMFLNVRVCHAIYMTVLVWIEMFVCRYFVCWVEFDQLYFSYLLKNGWPVSACADVCNWEGWLF